MNTRSQLLPPKNSPVDRTSVESLTRQQNTTVRQARIFVCEVPVGGDPSPPPSYSGPELTRETPSARRVESVVSGSASVMREDFRKVVPGGDQVLVPELSGLGCNLKAIHCGPALKNMDGVMAFPSPDHDSPPAIGIEKRLAEGGHGERTEKRVELVEGTHRLHQKIICHHISDLLQAIKNVVVFGTQIGLEGSISPEKIETKLVT
jgi:hypothetical protein